MKYNTICAWCRKVDTEQIIVAINKHCDNEGTKDYIYTYEYGNYYSIRGNTSRKMSLSNIRLYFYNVVCDGDDDTFREKIKEIIN